VKNKRSKTTELHGGRLNLQYSSSSSVLLRGLLFFILLFVVSSLWAGGRKDKTETVTEPVDGFETVAETTDGIDTEQPEFNVAIYDDANDTPPAKPAREKRLRRKDRIETVTAGGGEIWENDFDVTQRKKGIWNFIVYARDRAGNEAISGAFNVKIDPNAGLPIARVVYPENNAVIRQNINVLGVAAGRYGVSRVLARMDDGIYADVSGLEYWSRLIDFANIPDGKHTLYVQAVDSKGVAGPEQRLDFILDTTPPRIELLSHSIGDIITGTTSIKGEAIDPNGIRSIAYSEDGVKYSPLSGKKRDAATQEFSLSINTKKTPDGPVVYYLRTVDMTGVATVNPYLFFVTNTVPELEVYSPAAGEDVYDTFFLSGRAYDKIGLSALYYEWGKVRESIQMRPGDPFWHVPLIMEKDSAASIKVVAVDKVGNTASVTCKLEDRRKVKAPVLVIDYPPDDVLKTMNKGIPPDMAIYGHIAPGIDPLSVMVEGFGEVEALSAFRIAAHMIPPDPKAQTLKFTPVAVNGARGVTVSLRYLKQEPLTRNETEVNISSPEKNSWLSGSSFDLRGTIGSLSNAQLEYRLGPDEYWQPLRLDEEGSFETSVNIADRPQGPVHLELRTVMYGEENYPLYHPFNRAVDQPDIQILAPVGDHSLVFGSKTVTGAINHTVPIQQIAYSLDNEEFIDIPFVSRYGKAWFNYFCDFTSLDHTEGRLVFRVTDSGGAAFDIFPEYTVNITPPVPVIIVNSPVDDEIFPNPFEISGLAYYDVPIKGVYWRILGPNKESISTGEAGEYARREADIYEANPDRPFQETLTTQNFRIPVDYSMVTDGEYIVEIYASDIYGMLSETVSRRIKVSTAPPETEVMWPIITRYNQKAIMVKGFSSDANDVDNVSISMDNGNTYQFVELEASGDWEIALNTAAYTDGIYSALIRSEDKYGVVAFSNAMVNIDNTPPELHLSSPLDGQHVGTDMPLMGRVSDNVTLKSLTYQIINVETPSHRKTIDADPSFVIFDTISFDGFPQGEYILRIVAQDLADNETLVSRKIVYDADDKAAEINIYNPLPGEIHSGPVHVVGIVSGSFQPQDVRLLINGSLLGVVPVERYGIFRYEIPESLFSGGGEAYRISAAYDSETGTEIASPEHVLYYSAHGPTLQIESHQDGDVITGRPWLSGRAWITLPEPAEDDPPLTRSQIAQQKKDTGLRDVMVSHDNGRTFNSTRGSAEWKIRLETSELPLGPQPVLVRAVFANGEEAVRRLMLIVDTTLPQVETISPSEDSRHRDNIMIYGTAGDNLELDHVSLSLRPGNKFFYSIPGAVKGMYFDIKGLGATYFDVGLGLSLFNDNVRLQAQFGLTPADGILSNVVEGGRYVGRVYGVKLLANIFYLPFSYLFGLDWAFYSMNFAVGANFSWFTMDDWRKPLFMGAIVGQWDIANVNMQYFNPNWKYFRNYALYISPELWFASSDINAETILRMTVGMRINWF